MNSKKINSKSVVRMVVGIGIFSALAFIVSVLCSPIPKVMNFLSIDAKDSVIAIASFIYGPIVAPIISLITAALELVSVGSATWWYGFVMNFASSAVFSLVASLIYSHKKSINTALIGFFSAIVATTGVMLLLNCFVTPVYLQQMGIDFDVVAYLPKLFLPFNFAKTLLNSAIAMMLYKPIINAMRRARLIPASEYKTTFNKGSVVILSVGAALLAVSVVILILLLALL